MKRKVIGQQNTHLSQTPVKAHVEIRTRRVKLGKTTRVSLRWRYKKTPAHANAGVLSPALLVRFRQGPISPGFRARKSRGPRVV
jgi:hypothetical protein